MIVIRRAAAGAVLLLALASSGANAAQQAGIAALGGIEPGLWQVSAAGEPVHNICVMDPAALTQVRHGAAACARLVIADGRTGTTVHYSCPGAGWGRTSLRVSSPTSVKIDTQGIADNAPFAFVAQAHRTGACGAMRANLVH